MPQGIAGADSVDQVTQSQIEQAAGFIGTTPRFWGRYFCSLSNPSPYEYTHSVENAPLRQNNIKLLPIAEQTWRVAGSGNEGSADARGNVDDLLATFGDAYLESIGTEFLMFLDVEGSSAANPSLSASYYQGWAETLEAYSRDKTGGRFAVLPAVYASRDDDQTWATLQQTPAPCHGVWIASYGAPNPPSLPAIWDARQTTTQGAQLSCPVLIWQYAGNLGSDQSLDCNMTNPSIAAEKELMDRLILPP